MKKFHPYSLYASLFMLAVTGVQFMYIAWTDRAAVMLPAIFFTFALAVACLAKEANRLSIYKRHRRYVFGWAIHSSKFTAATNVFCAVCIFLVFEQSGMTGATVAVSVLAWILLLVFAPKLFLFIDMVANALLDGIPTRVAWIDNRLSHVVNIESAEYQDLIKEILKKRIAPGQRSVSCSAESFPMQIKGVNWIEALARWGDGMEYVVGKAVDDILHTPTRKQVRVVYPAGPGSPMLVVDIDQDRIQTQNNLSSSMERG